MSNLSILVLDDEESLADEIVEYLVDIGHRAQAAYRPSAALEMLEGEPFDIFLLDLRLPERDGLSVLAEVKKRWAQTEVIVMSGHGDMTSVIQAFRLGAFDFLKKSFRPADVQIAIERTGKYGTLRREYRNLQRSYKRLSDDVRAETPAAYIGDGKQARRVHDSVRRAACNPETNVLITGESGTGKELIARMIHNQSDRKDHRMVAVNCAAVPAELFESEFYGHERGSFTGADSLRIGRFEAADGGTLFLDEIGELPLELQTKLLRTIEYQRFSRVGGTDEVQVDVRVIAATNSDLAAKVRDRSFRLDLFHRINTLEITAPPLRERREDIDPLTRFFSQDLSRRMGRRPPKIDEALLDRLRLYRFPGNVRELRNLIERGLIYSDDLLQVELPAEEPQPTGDPSEPPVGPHRETDRGSHLPTLRLEELERAAIREALEASRWNQRRAAALLGISRQALARRMARFDLTEHP